MAVQPAALPRILVQWASWKPPQELVFKVNYDGAVFLNSNILGIGVVARNSDGQVIASLAQQLNQVYKGIEIEAMEATWALEFAVELGLDGVVIEGDSSIVTTALKTKELGSASYSFLISDAYVF